MARSKTIRFYDIPLPLDLPEAQNWLHDYHHHSKVLADYMKAHGAGSSVCHSMNSCLTELRDYLLEKGIQYSPENAMYWCNENKARTRSYLITLFRLSDIFCNGSVQPANGLHRVFLILNKLYHILQLTITLLFATRLKQPVLRVKKQRNCRFMLTVF